MKGHEVLKQLATGKDLLQNKLPHIMQNFQDLHDSILADGKLSSKQKRLIGLGMAIALKCEYCIVNHLKALKEMGTTLDEILEVCSVGILMHGGPGLAYSTFVVKTWEEI